MEEGHYVITYIQFAVLSMAWVGCTRRGSLSPRCHQRIRMVQLPPTLQRKQNMFSYCSPHVVRVCVAAHVCLKHCNRDHQ